MKKFFRDSGLSWAMAALFAVSIGGMVWSGWLDAAEEARNHADAVPSLGKFLASGDFISPLFENWESEFLQMAVYVVLTALLFQRGSAESRDPDDPEREGDEVAPGLGGWLYAHSLGLALAVLFVASFFLHAWGSWQMGLEDAARHGRPGHGFWPISAPHSSGSNRCRTGSRNSCPQGFSSCCRSSCATRVRPNRSRCRRRTARQEPERNHGAG